MVVHSYDFVLICVTERFCKKESFFRLSLALMDTVFSLFEFFPQVVGRANCLVASGDYIFIGLSTGLSVFSMSLHEKLCSWEAAKLEICALWTSDLGNESHLLCSVDEMGRLLQNICIIL